MDLNLFERHLTELKGMKPKSCKLYLDVVTEFFHYRRQASQDGPVSKITGQNVSDYLQWNKNAGNGNQRRRFKLCALSAFFRFLIHSRIIENDPTAGIVRPEPRNDILHSFTRAEVLQLFNAIDTTTEKGIRDSVFLILGVFAGLRVKEIIDINSAQIMDDGNSVSLNIVKNKKGGNRIIVLWNAPSAIIRSLLSARMAKGCKKGDPLLVSYNKSGKPRGNRRLTIKALNNLLVNLASRAGIQKPVISTHLLRTTHVRDLQCISGYDMPEIMKRMGFYYFDSVARYFLQHNPIAQKFESLSDYWMDFDSVYTARRR